MTDEDKIVVASIGVATLIYFGFRWWKSKQVVQASVGAMIGAMPINQIEQANDASELESLAEPIEYDVSSGSSLRA